jgi:sodium/bile acid cotransporter 7
MAISMVAVLTRAAGGDDASAIFHEALGNLLGIFLSPALILGYLGVAGSVDMVEVFYRLIVRVVVPVFLGQGLKRCSPAVVAFSDKHEYRFTQIKQYTLLFIIYTVFCGTFADDSKDASLGDIFLMVAIILGTLILLMLLSWTTFRIFFRDSTKLRVTALFATTEKTIALGIPLITTMYQRNPNLGLYTVPLIMWYSTQLVVGTLICPKLREWTLREQKRLGQVDLSDAASCDNSVSPCSSTFDDQDVDPEALPEQK